jgi:hypothetical protein
VPLLELRTQGIFSLLQKEEVVSSLSPLLLLPRKKPCLESLRQDSKNHEARPNKP